MASKIAVCYIAEIFDGNFHVKTKLKYTIV